MTAIVGTRDVVASRLRQLPPLLRPLVGAVRWQPSMGAAALVVLLVTWQAEPLQDQSEALRALRGVAVVLALGAAFLLDDPAAGTLEASPTSLAWRRAARLGAAVLLVGAPWSAAALTVELRGAGLPVAGLTLELVTVVTLALAGAAGLARWADAREPGALTVPLVAGFALALFQVPERWALLVHPGPEWGPAHQRWALLLGVAVLVLLACSRDPAHARRRVTLPGGLADPQVASRSTSRSRWGRVRRPATFRPRHEARCELVAVDAADEQYEVSTLDGCDVRDRGRSGGVRSTSS